MITEEPPTGERKVALLARGNQIAVFAQMGNMLGSALCTADQKSRPMATRLPDSATAERLFMVLIGKGHTSDWSLVYVGAPLQG